MLIPKDAFVVSRMCATDGMRYATDHVYVAREDGGECVAAATNGKMLMEARWIEEQIVRRLQGLKVETLPHEKLEAPAERVAGTATTIPRPVWDNAGKFMSGKTQVPAIQMRERGLNDQIALHHVEAGVQHDIAAPVNPDLRFPPYYREVFKPASKTDRTVLLCPLLLRDILTALTAGMAPITPLGDHQGIRITITEDEYGPVRFSVLGKNGSKIVALLMPIYEART